MTLTNSKVENNIAIGGNAGDVSLSGGGAEGAGIFKGTSKNPFFRFILLTFKCSLYE